MHVLSYPYLWQNCPNVNAKDEYVGKKSSEMFDPRTTLDIVNKASHLSKKILVFVEMLERKESEGGLRGKLIRPLRYLLEHLPTIQTLKAARCWHQVTQAFDEKNWDKAIESLHQLNSRKEKEEVIRFPYASLEDFNARSGIRVRDNLIHLSPAVEKASWVKQQYYCDGLFPVYLSLISTAYFNRALQSNLEKGQLTTEAKRDLERAKIYAQVFARGLQEYTWKAIEAFEKGIKVPKG